MPNRRAARNTTNVVVRQSPGNTNRGTRHKPQRAQAQAQQPGQVINVTVPRLRRRNPVGGPAVRVPTYRRPFQRQKRPRIHQNVREIHQTITTTLGTVGANTSNDVETELTAIINPATMKEQTGSNNFGPLNIMASQYGLWKLKSMNVKLKPLVGNNAATGTITRVSYNPTTGAGQTSWSSLGARKHTDVSIGRAASFTITEKDVKGPKAGWFFTNTTNDAVAACGGTLNIHSLGKTTNPYTNQNYQGPLFLAEVTSTWMFKDYLQQPGLINMVKGETAQNAKVVVDSTTGKIQMEVENTSRLGELGASPSTSQVIWTITDTIIQAGTAALPPPFGWLIRGGWWFIKRAAGAPVSGAKVLYDIFPSMTDAQNDKYIYSTNRNFEGTNIEQVQYQQITPSNTGIASESLVERQVIRQPDGYYIETLQSMPEQTWVPAQPLYVEKVTNASPPVAVPRSERGLKIKFGNNWITTYNMLKVGVDAPEPTQGIPMYMRDSAEVQIGLAVAGSYAMVTSQNENVAGESGVKNIHLTNVLFYATRDRAYNFTRENDGIFQTSWLTFNRFRPQLQLASGTDKYEWRMQVNRGGWYLAQFLCVGQPQNSALVGGIPIKAPRDGWPTGTTETYNVNSTDESVIKGVPPVYGNRVYVQTFQEFTTQWISSSREAPVPVGVSDVEDEGCEDWDDPQLQLDDDDGYGDPPVSRLSVVPEAEQIYQQLLEKGLPVKAAARAVNQLYPSEGYVDFCQRYHDALVDGFSPPMARAIALGLE